MFYSDTQPRIPALLLPSMLLVLALASCRFNFDNPAEELVPGQIRGKTVQEIEGKAREFEAVPQVKVRLRGAPFQLNSRPTGYFALLDLSAGDYELMLEHASSDESERRLVQRGVALALGGDGQIEGVNVGEVAMAYTASVSGRVVNEETGEGIAYATVSDESSLLSVTADEAGFFTFPALATGEHTFRAAGSLALGSGGEVEAVGGTLKLKVGAKDERKTLKLDSALQLQPASGQGRLQLKLGLMSPAPAQFGLEEIGVSATPCQGGDPIVLAAPASNGQLDDTLPAGCWNVQLLPPPGEDSAEFDLVTSVANVILLDDDDLDLGTLILASSQSVRRSQNVCEVDADCHSKGKCVDKSCEYPKGKEPEVCSEALNPCHDQATCEDDDGLALCECKEGYVGDGFTCRPDGRFGIPGDACTALDCDSNASCVEQRGDLACVCNEGYSGDGQSCEPAICADLDCGDNAHCEEYNGDALCVCDEGYSGDGQSCEPTGICADFECGDNAHCEEHNDDALCVCDEGFSDDGQQCVPEDPCDNLSCDDNAQCQVVEDEAGCFCNPGYEGDGETCANINECTSIDPITELPLHDCAPEAICTDTEGSYTCACPSGMVGDGNSCDPDFSSLALGHGHSCRTSSSGELWCWGDNSAGQLGLGDITLRSTPSSLGVAIWKKITANANATCGIDAEDHLFCWGNNEYSSIPDPSSAVVHPTPVDDSLLWKDVAISDLSYCGVTVDGELYCWGNWPASGEELEMISPESDWSAVFFAGYQTLCGTRRIDGTPGHSLWCLGDNYGEKLGYFEFSYLDEMTQIVDLGYFDEIPQLAFSYSSTCFIDNEDRDLFCMGSEYGGMTMHAAGPWRRLSGNGQGNLCLVNENQQLYCEGSNWAGLLGLGFSLEDHEGLQEVAHQLSFIDVQLGSQHACALTSDRELYCWGQNESAQLGFSEWPRSADPIQVDSHNDWRQVSAGTGATCGLRNQPGLWCWGNNENSRVAVMNDVYGLPEPVLVEDETQWSQLSLGRSSGCAIDEEFSQLWCWGERSRFGGGSGSESELVNINYDQQEGWLQVEVKENTCALESGSRQIFCGGDSLSFLHIETMFDIDFSGGVWGLLDSEESFASFSLGGAHICAINEDGQLFCQGMNESFQTGILDMSEVMGFEEVLHPEEPGVRWTQVSAGTSHTCALSTDSSLWCWGNNAYGQLGVSLTQGDFTAEPQKLPGNDWSQVSAGERHSCGQKIDGSVLCWGDNQEGQLGIGSIDGSLHPPSALSGQWLQVSTGEVFQSFNGYERPELSESIHSCGIRPEAPGQNYGSLWCWGSTHDGQTGTSTSAAFAPKRVNTLSSY